MVAACLQRLDISDPAQATDNIKRWRQTSVTRLYHADPPVSCHGIADKGAITRFEYMQGQVHAREQQRARQGEDRDALQSHVSRTGWQRGDDVATTPRHPPAQLLQTASEAEFGQIGRASSRERVGQYAYIWVVAEALKKKNKKQ